MSTRIYQLIIFGVILVAYGLLLHPHISKRFPTIESGLGQVSVYVGTFLIVIGVLFRFGALRRLAAFEFDTLRPRSVDRESHFANRNRMSAVTFIIAVYILVVEYFSLYPLFMPMPGGSLFYHRVGESAVLWVVSWSVLGWLSVWNREVVTHGRDRWIISALPLFVGAFGSCIEIYDLVMNDSSMTPDGLFLVMCWVIAFFPLLFGVSGTVTIFLQYTVWIRLTRWGRCSKCDYNLTGNVSGVCPECGQLIASRTE